MLEFRTIRLVFIQLLILLGAMALAEGPTSAARPSFWGDLQAGRYGVGFRTHVWAGGELHVWYPAADEGEAVRFGEYLRLSRDLVGAVEGFTTDESAMRRTLAVAITGKEGGLSDQQASDILAMPMAAKQNATAAAGSFPLVLWTHRYATTAAQSVLSEYLAGYGMVVVYAPESATPPMPFQFESAEEREQEFARQITRLREALKESRKFSFVRPGRVAVMAWSYAGESAYGFQQAEDDVAVVVAFSTNVLSGWEYRPDALAKFEPATITAPYVLITEPKAHAAPSWNERLMKEAAAPIFLTTLPKMKHGAFNALEGMIPAIMGISTVQPWSLAGQDAKLGYEVAAQYARRALEHYLVAVPTQDTPFALWGPNGDIPEGFVSVQMGGKPRPVPAQPVFVPVEFKSHDGLLVSADLYPIGDKNAPMIVLVHQSGASRGEYRQIAPRLNELGFNALAIDSRWGRLDRWNGVENMTARRYGTAQIVASGDRTKMRAIDRVADLNAALHWVKQEGYSGPILIWGSSITANGVLEIASAKETSIAGLLAFSPGEYDEDNPAKMQGKVKNLAVPAFIACGEDEEQLSGSIFRAIPEGNKWFFHAARGRHGSSILIDDPENWKPVENFLQRLSGRSTVVP